MHSRIVIARPQGGRGNLAVPGGITGKPRRKRNCLPEIATSACGLLAMTNLGVLRRRIHAAHAARLQGAQGTPLQTQSVHTFLTSVCTGRQRCAGPGCPLPYNDFPILWKGP